MYSIRHELQRSADAGALAGASAFTAADWSLQSTKDLAEARAKEFATKDKVAQTELTLSDVAVGFPQVDQIEVVTSRTASLFFARVLGRDNQVISARAVARAASTNMAACVKPWAVPLPWVDDNTTNGLFDPAEGVSVKRLCTTQILTDCVPAGTQMTLKIGSPSSDNSSPSGQQTAGQFFIIQGNTTDPFRAPPITESTSPGTIVWM
jgi:hypothetical protein